MNKTKTVVFTLLSIMTIVLGLGISTAAASPLTGHEDEFTNSTLQPFWTFVNPSGLGSYNLTDKPTWLTITAPGNQYIALSQKSNFDAPRILQNVTGDFIATTNVTGNFDQDGFRAGLLVWGDQDNYLRFEKWGRDKLLLYGYLNGFENNKHVSTTSCDMLYLKLEKFGSTVTASYSYNEISWITIYSYTLNTVDPVEVGLFAINVGSATFNAEFDYFHICPNSPFVVPEYPLGPIAIPLAIAAAVLIRKQTSKQKTN
ncbi:MAG: DUF1349 domain-containing protein [Candidatus Bathyarchaeota archaeon]|nr:DUF1349 domain-containing protein [Candidatus Bathyarchaeota archaeon]